MDSAQVRGKTHELDSILPQPDKLGQVEVRSDQVKVESK